MANQVVGLLTVINIIIVAVGTMFKQHNTCLSYDRIICCCHFMEYSIHHCQGNLILDIHTIINFIVIFQFTALDST